MEEYKDFIKRTAEGGEIKLSLNDKKILKAFKLKNFISLEYNELISIFKIQTEELGKKNALYESFRNLIINNYIKKDEIDFNKYKLTEEGKKVIEDNNE